MTECTYLCHLSDGEHHIAPPSCEEHCQPKKEIRCSICDRYSSDTVGYLCTTCRGKYEESTEPKKSWEENFDEKFKAMLVQDYIYTSPESIKSFIKEEIDKLKEELRITNELPYARNSVLSLIPECKAHGFCLPEFEKWIINKLKND